MFLERISTWARSESDALGLAVLLYSSPLSPLKTLEELREHGFYPYLPTPDDVLDGRYNPHISGRMREVLEAARRSQMEGDRKALEGLYRKLISGVSTQLELMDYNISQLYQFVSVFTSIVPSVIASVLLFTNPRQLPAVLVGTSLMSVLAGFLGLAFFPWELRLPGPGMITYIPFTAIPAIYYALERYSVPNGLLLSTIIASIPASVEGWRYLRRRVDAIDSSCRILEKASSCPWNLFACIGVEEPEEVISGDLFGIAGAASLGVYLLGIYGSEDVQRSVGMLEEAVREYVGALNSLKGKTRIMLFYAMLESGIAAVIYSVLISAAQYFSSFSSAGAPLYLPLPREVEGLRRIVDPVLLLCSLGLSIATSSSREGNPLYFPVYLPLTAGATWLGFYIAWVFTPMIVGWRR